MNDLSELAKALAAAQAEMTNAPMLRINPHFKSKYADLASVRDATIPALSKNGLCIAQTIEHEYNGHGGSILRTRLFHSSGAFIESVYPLPNAADKPQIFGSALTYGRRYSWASICGIASEEDDDANEASKSTTNGKVADKPTLPNARAREPYAKLVLTMEKINGLDELDGWWKSEATMKEHSRLPINWQVEAFAEFMRHGIKIAETRQARSVFWNAYRDHIKSIPDDDIATDLVETYKSAQLADADKPNNLADTFTL